MGSRQGRLQWCGPPASDTCTLSTRPTQFFYSNRSLALPCAVRRHVLRRGQLLPGLERLLPGWLALHLPRGLPVRACCLVLQRAPRLWC